MTVCTMFYLLRSKITNGWERVQCNAVYNTAYILHPKMCTVSSRIPKAGLQIKQKQVFVADVINFSSWSRNCELLEKSSLACVCSLWSRLIHVNVKSCSRCGKKIRFINNIFPRIFFNVNHLVATTDCLKQYTSSLGVGHWWQNVKRKWRPKAFYALVEYFALSS